MIWGQDVPRDGDKSNFPQVVERILAGICCDVERLSKAIVWLASGEKGVIFGSFSFVLY
jgi:hypothetical protein